MLSTILESDRGGTNISKQSTVERVVRESTMAMAVALLEPEFASKILEPKDDGCGIISETGIILGAEDVEEFIVAEIEKLHVRNQRANTKSVCKALAKSHGLTTRVVSLQLKRMILTGRSSPFEIGFCIERICRN